MRFQRRPARTEKCRRWRRSPALRRRGLPAAASSWKTPCFENAGALIHEWHVACIRLRQEESMRTETILLIDSSERVRDVVARSYAQAGAYVEALASCAEAIDFLAAFRPDWILVDERQAGELLHWLRGQEDRRDVPIVLLPDLDLSAPDREP